MAVKNSGKFSSTFIFEPPKENPHFFKYFLKKVYISTTIKIALPIKINGKA